MNVWIGTSGYSYPSWVGDYYPRGTRSSQMLPYYCRFFPLNVMITTTMIAS